jgi:hypothetical protein
MNKKFFALAACTGLTGLVVSVAASGCSSDSGGTPDTADTGADVKKTPPAPPPDDGGDGAAGDCPSTASIDTSAYPWKPPAVDLGKCTDADLTSLVAYLQANSGSKYADWKSKAGLGATCSGCLFGPDGTTWKPFVEDSSGDLSELNVGGCIGIASANEKCGQSYQAWFDCRFEACASCPTDTATLTKCLSAASKGACKAANQNVLTVCGSAIGDYETACRGDKYVFEGPIKAQCINGLGSTDAGDGG